jgi:hypothetical protein
MDKKKARELLKQALIQIHHLRRLHPKNQELKVWYEKVCNILKEVSGVSSWEYRQFTSFTHLYRPTSDAERHVSYNSYLDSKEIVLNSIINKYEPWYKKILPELKDFITTSIAKFAAEKTK